MRFLFAVALFALPALAAEPPKAKLLSMENIEDGYVQLFDGESTFGWKTEGEVAVKDGKLVLPPKSKLTYFGELPSGTISAAFDKLSSKAVKLEGFGKALEGGIPGASENVIVVGTDSVASSGSIRLSNQSTETIELKTMTYHPEKTKPLFNGKDLTGWKVHDEAKKNLSKFDVTDKGELRLVNGPGDLQTTAKYADFLLQFQCKTNGDGLNSGVFFRCIEGQYQNGYECQISNKAKKTDPAKPDDFGTGAIYRRVEARKLVAKDKEWFAVTLVAHGDRFASWVNGYPVVSWQDDRKPDENPRKGLRTAAGHLSLQGHDPTTDILFRDIKIAEYPAEKK